MHSTHTHKDGEAAAFGRDATSPSAQASAAGSQVIPFISNSRPSAAALLALEDESSPDMFESIGELSVRLVGRWKLPRINVQAGHRGGEGRPAAHEPSWEG